MKAVSCDSSSIITLSTNCLLWLLEKFEADFLVAPYVMKEIVENPLNTKRYGFEAMRNGLAIGKSLKVEKSDPELRDKIIRLSNMIYMHKGRAIEIIQNGEADAVSLAINKGINTLLVDEKNTRLLIEDKEVLRRVVEKRTHKHMEINEDAASELEKILDGLKIIRSSEVVAVAIKRGMLDWPYSKKDLTKNALTSLKYSGCAISSAEILEITNTIAPTSHSVE